MKRIKKKFQNITMSNGIVGTFNSADITPLNMDKYLKGGFAHIFEDVCYKCEKLKCNCK